MSIEKDGYRHMPLKLKVSHELSSSEGEMKRAKDFFQKEFQLRFDEQGFAVTPSLEQVERLAEWRKEVGIMPETPTVETFYQKTLLAASLWRQESDGKIHYLFGKGAGVEIALLGEVEGREKRRISFSYRPHSDYELYAVESYKDNEGNFIEGKRIYTDEFLKVFGGQEYFPVTKTKGLRNLPLDLLHEKAERVRLGDITVLVPQLEILFLDKWRSRETTPRPEGFDDEILAQQYQLDKDLLHDYLQHFVIEPGLKEIEGQERDFIDKHFEAIANFVRAYNHKVRAINAEMAVFLDQPNMRYFGVAMKFWVPLEAHQIDGDGRIVDEGLKEKISARIKKDFADKKQNIFNTHQELDQYFVDLNKKS